MATQDTTTHQFYQPVWLAVDPDITDLARIEARSRPVGYIGVHKETVRKTKARFAASIRVAGVWYRSRRYLAIEDAARAYNTLATYFFGEAPALNDVSDDPTIQAGIIKKIVARQIRQIATDRGA